MNRSITLFPDQQRLVAAVGSSLRTHRSTVVQAPTGSGKTVIAAWIADRFLSVGKTVVIIVPRRELAYQFQGALEDFGRYFGLIMAGEERVAGDGYICTFDTLHARCVQRDIHELPQADVVIGDEVHLALARTRKEILESYPDAIQIGLTATPARADGKGLGRLYNDLVLGPSIRELIDLGRLVEPRYFTGPRPQLDDVRVVSGGDFHQAELDAAVDQPKLVGDIVENWLAHGEGRQTVVFCTSLKHSRHVRERFEKHGIACEHVDGNTPHEERADIFYRVRTGATTVLTNVAVATYGLDIPELSCAVMARPTKSMVLYFQTIGRILRTAPGKTDCIVLDHSGCVEEHGFIDQPVAWSLHGNARNDTEAVRRERKEPQPIECPECQTIFQATHICPACGFKLSGGKAAVPYYEQELAEIDRDKKRKNREVTTEEKRAFFGALKYYGRDRGYSDGWAAHKYREAFGVWPNAHKDAPLVRPGQKVLNWITSRNIAARKRREAEVQNG